MPNGRYFWKPFWKLSSHLTRFRKVLQVFTAFPLSSSQVRSICMLISSKSEINYGQLTVWWGSGEGGGVLHNTDGEGILLWTHCRYRGLISGLHGSLGPERLIKMPNVTVHHSKELYWVRPAQDTVLQEKLNHSCNRIAILFIYRHGDNARYFSIQCKINIHTERHL